MCASPVESGWRVASRCEGLRAGMPSSPPLIPRSYLDGWRENRSAVEAGPGYHRASESRMGPSPTGASPPPHPRPLAGVGRALNPNERRRSNRPRGRFALGAGPPSGATPRATRGRRGNEPCGGGVSRARTVSSVTRRTGPPWEGGRAFRAAARTNGGRRLPTPRNREARGARGLLSSIRYSSRRGQRSAERARPGSGGLILEEARARV